MAKPAKKTAITLAAIVAATQSANGFMFAKPADVASFVSGGDADMNVEIRNPDNADEVAVRATPQGMEKVNTPTEQPKAVAPAKPKFEISFGEAPATRSRGRTGTLYPFGDLPEPRADGAVARFFVAATESKPEPWKSLQSAVSAATRRYATVLETNTYTKPDGTEGTRSTYDYTRKFVVSEGEQNGVKGAFVSRVA